ncbi:MAG: hypothetical protein K2P70_10285 [Hyphomonadaceae bacterium]|nr:hypothetical protein [Hyphomonadaceae bacterium]
MSQYLVEYREWPEGPVLKSDSVIATNDEDAEARVKQLFTLVQANLGARHYRILDDARAVVATHATPKEPLGRNL